MDEVWADIPGYEGFYQVSTQGNVRGVRRALPSGRVLESAPLALSKNRGGYLKVRLCRDGVHRFHVAHRLVLLAFVGPCPAGMECAHNNGIRSDNRLENLRWDTRGENAADRIRHGTVARGDRNIHAKLVEADIREIRRRRASGERLADIATDFSVTSANICAIAKRQTWGWVQ